MKLGSHPLTLTLLLIVIMLFAIMGRFFPAALAIPLPGSDIRPVLLLEFASIPQHLVHIFGEVSDPMRDARIAGMNTGNAIDYLLMPAYGLLTLSFFRGVTLEIGGKLWALFGAMGIAAAASDAVENWLMFQMVADMADPLGEMALLPFPVWAKFGLLAISCGGAAWAFARMRRWLLVLLCLPAPLLLVPAMLDPFGTAPLATTTIGLGWLAMGIHAATRWLRPVRG